MARPFAIGRVVRRRRCDESGARRTRSSARAKRVERGRGSPRTSGCDLERASLTRIRRQATAAERSKPTVCGPPVSQRSTTSPMTNTQAERGTEERGRASTADTHRARSSSKGILAVSTAVAGGAACAHFTADLGPLVLAVTVSFGAAIMSRLGQQARAIARVGEQVAELQASARLAPGGDVPAPASEPADDSCTLAAVQGLSSGAGSALPPPCHRSMRPPGPPRSRRRLLRRVRVRACPSRRRAPRPRRPRSRR